jgi:hypothetical protein
MTSPKLPTRPSDTWDCEFIFESAHDVRAVSARGGLVMAGGDELYMVRPGAQGMASRARPQDMGQVVAVASEPRAPFRYAFATAEMVVLFMKSEQGEQTVRLRPMLSGASPTHIAWGPAEGANALWIRWSDGAVVRTNRDMSSVDVLDVQPMDALAADGNGVIAMVSFAEPEPRAYTSKDGESFQFRPLGVELKPADHVFMAVADEAVAYAIKGVGAFMSRAVEVPFTRSEPLGAAGPVEFQGESSDAALLGASRYARYASIVRVDREGAALRIADFGSDDAPAPEITCLSWDASRRVVWGASPQMGIVRCTEPSAKHGKIALS